MVSAREAERQKTFEEVRDQVLRSLRAGKEKEIQSRLIDELKERYNVVIHRSRFTDEDSQSGKENETEK
jgi:hypothetical protein